MHEHQIIQAMTRASFYFDPFKQSHSTLQGNLMVIGMFLLKTVLKIIYVLTAAPSILSAGAMIGIVIGSLAFIIALLVAVILLVALRYRRYKSKTSSINESSQPDM